MLEFVYILFFYTKFFGNFCVLGTNKCDAISLCEVLITLGVVGTIGLYTMPNFNENHLRMATVTSVKKAYSTYSNGFERAIADYGTPDNWNLVGEGDPTGLANMNTILSKYFNVVKNCGNGPGCFPEENYRNLKGIENDTNLNQDPTYTKLMLSDGTSMAITQWSADCDIDWGDTLALRNVCGIVGFDINGNKAPNVYGYDFFGFAFTKYGLVPLGSQMQTNYPLNGFCNPNSNANFKYENGLSCTSWVMQNENLEYQECPGLNWGGKTTCKK